MLVISQQLAEIHCDAQIDVALTALTLPTYEGVTEQLMQDGFSLLARHINQNKP